MNDPKGPQGPNDPSGPSGPDDPDGAITRRGPGTPSARSVPYASHAPSGLADRLGQARPYALGLFRIAVGLLFACHGAAALFGVLGGPMGGTVPAGTWPGWYAAVIQLGAGGLVLAGLGTRSAAFLASGSMAYAYFTVHQPQALFPLQNGGENAALFCWAFVLLVFTGPGALSLDQLFGGRIGPETTTHGPHAVREEQGAPVTA